MEIMEQLPSAEVTPRTLRGANRWGKAPDRSGETRETHDDPGAASFAHLLVERQERPEPKGGFSSSEKQPESTGVAPTMETSLAGGVPVSEGDGQMPEMLTVATVPTVSAEVPGPSEAGVQPTQAPVFKETTTEGPAAAEAGTSVAIPETAATAVPTVTDAVPAGPELIETQTEPASGATCPTGVVIDGETIQVPGSGPVEDVAQAGRLSVPAVLPVHTGQSVHATPVLAGPVVDAAKTETVPDAISDPSAAAASGMTRPEAGMTATDVSAVKLAAANEAQVTYARTPVATESQLLTNSLKTIHKQKHPNMAKIVVLSSRTGVTPPTDVVPASRDEDSSGEISPAAESTDEATVHAAAAVAPDVVSESVEAGGALAKRPVLDAAQAPAVEHAVAAPAAAVENVVMRTADGSEKKSASWLPADKAVSHQVRQQVVNHLAGRLGKVTGHESVTIKLNPESLGQVELSFESREDRLSVVIAATTPEADAALRENLKDLTERIVERSARFSHVEIRVEIREGNQARQDGKPDQKQDGRQERRSDQNGRGSAEDQQDQSDRHDRQARHARQSWENAMSWQLADAVAMEEE